MALLTILFFVVGFTLAGLSLTQRETVFNLTLPEHEIRRIWLPLGIIGIALGLLFALMTSVRMPSSPFYQAETRRALQYATQTRLQQQITPSATANTTIEAYKVMLTDSVVLSTTIYRMETRLMPTLTYSAYETATSQRVTAIADITATAASQPTKTSTR